MQKIYSANQVASLLGIPYSSVRTCMDKGELPYFTLPGGNQKRILEEDFLKFQGSVDVPEGLSRAITVEVGQTLIIDEGGSLTTFVVTEVSKHKISVERITQTDLVPHGGI